MISLLICALVFIGLSIPLYFGKMANMIAGYNTMSLTQKKQYDQKKLCLIIAMIFDGAAFFCLLGYFHILSFNDTVLFSITELLIGVIIANYLCKKK